MLIPAVRGISSAIKGFKGINRSLTRTEVLGIIKGLKRAFNSRGKARNRIYLVKDEKELMALWEKLTKNFKKEKFDEMLKK